MVDSRYAGFASLQQLAGELLLSSYEEYANQRSTLKFKCIDCDATIITTGMLYKRSIDNRRCTACKKKGSPATLDGRATFIQKCREIHGAYYTYEHVPLEFNTRDKITITCPAHGDFDQVANAHQQGHGCKQCGIDKISQANRSSSTDFVVQANKRHQFRYDYSRVKYINTDTPINITCPKHGDFQQTPRNHLQGTGCPLCTNTSSPVLRIIETLEQLNITYATEKTFNGCVGESNRPLRFDIFIPDRNLCVEYDGPHHYAPRRYGSMTDAEALARFHRQQQTDAIKDQYCECHNIKLIRIPYTVHHPEAFIRKYLTEDVSAERFSYSWDMLQQDVVNIANYIKSFNYDRFAVYGIARGGVLFSIPVSYHFDDIAEFGIVTFQRYDGNDKTVRFDITHKTHDIPIFVIDDLISSGKTMDKVCRALRQKFKKATIHPIVIYGDENDNGVFFIHEHPKQWIVFPYEI